MSKRASASCSQEETQCVVPLTPRGGVCAHTPHGVVPVLSTPASFIYSSMLQNPGTTHDGLFHTADWLPTLTRLAGGDTKRNLPLDGMDMCVCYGGGAAECR